MSHETPDNGRTPDEQAVINLVAERKGADYAEEHAELILLQACRVGDLPLDG
jgi:hypothetical protein